MTHRGRLRQPPSHATYGDSNGENPHYSTPLDYAAQAKLRTRFAPLSSAMEISTERRFRATVLDGSPARLCTRSPCKPCSTRPRTWLGADDQTGLFFCATYLHVM